MVPQVCAFPPSPLPPLLRLLLPCLFPIYPSPPSLLPQSPLFSSLPPFLFLFDIPFTPLP